MYRQPLPLSFETITSIFDNLELDGNRRNVVHNF